MEEKRKEVGDIHQQKRYPILVVISGPSGVGKDTISRMLIGTNPSNFHFVVTATSRTPRKDEVRGIDYLFVSTDEFEWMIDKNELLEYAIVYNDYKGIPKQQIRDALASGKDVIMRLDVQGASTIRQLIPEAITIFLTTASEENLIKRLKSRQSETPKNLNLRIAMARQEMKRAQEFDYLVVNAENKQQQAVNDILNIIGAAHCRTKQKPISI